MRRARWAAAALALVALGSVTTSSLGDVSGDGLDEIGVLGVESDGPARGPWFQAYDGEGKRQLSFFLGEEVSQPRVLTAELDGEAAEEIVVLGKEARRGVLLQVRNGKGRVLARASVLAAEALEDVRLLEVSGEDGPWIGVAYARPDGSGAVQLYRYLPESAARAAGDIEEGASLEVVQAGASGHQWLAEDLDGDGEDEIVAGTSDGRGFGGQLWIVHMEEPEKVVSRAVFPRAFTNASWVVADFRPAEPGLEIVAGAVRRKGGAGLLALYDGTGKRLARKAATRKGSETAWRALATPEPIEVALAGASAGHDLLVGYRTPKGSWEYRIWDLAAAKPERVLTQRVLGEEAEVADWIPGDYDGDATNGDEVVVLYTRADDRSIRYQQWSREGEMEGAAQLLGGEFFSPRGAAIRAIRADRDDLLVLAATVGGKPRATLWRTPGIGARLLDLRVLGPGVR